MGVVLSPGVFTYVRHISAGQSPLLHRGEGRQLIPHREAPRETMLRLEDALGDCM